LWWHSASDVFFGKFKEELHNLRKAPFSSAALGISVAGVVFQFMTWHYSGQIDALQTQIRQNDQEIHRIRVAAGMDVPETGALASLSNEELRSKATIVASRLHETCRIYHDRKNAIDKQFGESSRDQQVQEIDREMGDDFVRQLRTDAFNVDNELRRRLGSSAPEISPSFRTSDGTPIDIWTFTGSGAFPFLVMISCTLGDATDRMAKLLPAGK
jgi:hypothetical protein